VRRHRPDQRRHDRNVEDARDPRMSLQSDPVTATAHTRRLITLTEQLGQRLADETRAFVERRPGDVVASLSQTQELTNQYRRESAQLRAQPGLVSAAP